MMDSSGKLILLDKFLEKYKMQNHKMLIFSQFKGMIDLLQEYLRIKRIRYELLTGSVKSSDRAVSI
jgi:SNF2 family DNA or RNA helicase